jgi:hypothetical protein
MIMIMSRTLVKHHEQPPKSSSTWILTESFSTTGTPKSQATVTPAALLIPPPPRPPSVIKLPPPPPITGVFHVIFRQHSSTESLLSFTDIWSLLQSPALLLARSTPGPSPKPRLPPVLAPINFIPCSQGHTLLLKFPSAVCAESVMISAHVATYNDRLKIVAYPHEPSTNGESFSH